MTGDREFSEALQRALRSHEQRPPTTPSVNHVAARPFQHGDLLRAALESVTATVQITRCYHRRHVLQCLQVNRSRLTAYVEAGLFPTPYEVRGDDRWYEYQLKAWWEQIERQRRLLTPIEEFNNVTPARFENLLNRGFSHTLPTVT